MITKTLIKYKLLEWAAEAFFTGFSKLIGNGNRIFFKDAIEGKYYKAIVTKRGIFHNVKIEDKKEFEAVIEFKYYENLTLSTMTFSIFSADQKWYIDGFPSRMCNNIISVAGNFKFTEYYGETHYVKITIDKEDFDRYRNELEDLTIMNYTDFYFSEGDKDVYFIP